MESLKRKFEEGWWCKLSPFLLSSHMRTIGGTLTREITQGATITPTLDDTFRAFKECPYNNLKVVILGLDPYPAHGVADGLAFSAKNHPLDIPSSLKFMIDAIEKDVYNGFAIGFNENWMDSDLTRWANQGVLLLNQALTTHVGKIGTHLELWQPFIRYVFHVLRENNTGLIYILLGAKAKMWSAAIDAERNYVLTATHPNVCFHQGLKEWDCNKVFSTANKILMENHGEYAKILW
jgi:uracil-DNA glycosylase